MSLTKACKQFKKILDMHKNTKNETQNQEKKIKNKNQQREDPDVGICR